MTGVLLCTSSLTMPVHAQAPSSNLQSAASPTNVTGITWLDKTILILSGFGGLVGGIGAIVATFKLVEKKDATIQEKDAIIQKKDEIIKTMDSEYQKQNKLQYIAIQILEQQIDFVTKTTMPEELKNIIKEAKESITKLLNDKEKKLEDNEATLHEAEKAELRKQIGVFKSSLQNLVQFEKKIEAEHQAAKWLTDNAERLARDAAMSVIKKDILQEDYEKFQSTLNAYLDFIIFSLKGGQILPIDAAPKPNPSLIFEYKEAFRFIAKQIPEGMSEVNKDLLIFLLNHLSEYLT